MKTSQKIAILFLVAIFVYLIIHATFNANTIDIQIKDAYFILSYKSVFTFLGAFIVLMFFLAFVFRSAKKKK